MTVLECHELLLAGAILCVLPLALSFKAGQSAKIQEKQGCYDKAAGLYKRSRNYVVFTLIYVTVLVQLMLPLLFLSAPSGVPWLYRLVALVGTVPHAIAGWFILSRNANRCACLSDNKQSLENM